ncbi:unnamed protein product [Dicrocoelium dendriticum]|nr:unnamed protein product [Dicrocoelium dendriticum]
MRLPFIVLILIHTCAGEWLETVFDEEPVPLLVQVFEEVDISDLPKTLKALKKSLTYMHDNLEAVNLDGLIGPRIAESRIAGLLSRYWSTMPFTLVRELRQIQKIAAEVVQQGREFVKRKTPNYFSNVGFFTEPYVWDLYYPPRGLRYHPKWALNLEADQWYEQDIDNCMSEIYYSKYPECRITSQCWLNGTRAAMSSYSVSHQLIYLLIGASSECAGSLEQRLRSEIPPVTLGGLMHTMCGRMKVETETIANAGFPDSFPDLLMEQIAVCGAVGFLELSKPEWLDIIISWQADNGCYHKFKEEEDIPSENFAPEQYGNYRRRRKRCESIMSGGGEGCLAHRTSVAIGALVSYTILFIEAAYGLGRSLVS